MNQTQRLEQKGNLKKLCIICFLVMYSIFCFVISPLYIDVINDVVLTDTVLPNILQYFGSILELVAIAISYAAMIFAFYKFGINGAKWTGAIFIVATACKYTANVIVGWVTQASIPVSWIWDVLNVVFYTALEGIQFLIVYSISRRIICNSGKVSKQIFPFERTYDKYNPLLRSAFWCSIVTVIAKIFGRFVNDVWTMILYGPPEKIETVMLMIVTYALNIILGAVCYFVIYLILNQILLKYK